ncbi:OLC1v1015943C1 [Oldenlandia corymbosa var. corymbosa]|uniref:OLC1v1015943C1 n=1 Tax=Oldenlandia corymbosa var. corymbosa TaxID=529605 RepID=A0AAV1E763_OLDCO|nr:OLC1v1015943C1 [Oldenlandia corymbosa var. corymbosa]
MKLMKATVEIDADHKVNRISELPDSLLCHILSFLHIKQSAATSILSTRWKYLFAFVPDIDLEYMNPELHFDFINFCRRMIVLRLNLYYLMDVISIRKIMKGCPLLEELDIGCKCPENFGRENAIDVLEFSSSSMKKLVFHPFGERQDVTIIVASNSLQSLDCRLNWLCKDGSGEVILDTPNLKHLAFSGTLEKLNIIGGLESVDSVEVTNDSYSITSAEDLIVLLHRTQNALSICATIETLEASDGFSRMLPTFENLARLELNVRDVCSIRDWEALPFFLENAPNLEVLLFNHVSTNILWTNDFVEEEVECPVETIFPIHLIENLKEIGIKVFNNEEDEFAVVEHLFQNAKSLRKFTIGAAPEPSVCARISAFKRCSTLCQIVFDEWKYIRF